MTFLVLIFFSLICAILKLQLLLKSIRNKNIRNLYAQEVNAFHFLSKDL